MKEVIQHARIHRRPKIQKKWDKRFGVATIIYDDDGKIDTFIFGIDAKAVYKSKVKSKKKNKNENN